MDSVRPVLWSSKTQVSPRFQHRCNTDRPGLAVGRPLLPPVCLRGGLTKEQVQLESTKFTAERQRNAIKGGTVQATYQMKQRKSNTEVYQTNHRGTRTPRAERRS